MFRRIIAAAAVFAAVVTYAAPAQAGPAQDRAQAAVTRLLTYFDSGTGAWSTPTGEAWQPALGIESVINNYERTRSQTYLDVINKSFDHYRNGRSFYYDDRFWYLNAWIRAYDIIGDSKFLTEAEAIFADSTEAWDGTCGGGVWWNTDRQYKNAITNELFLVAAAQLHRRAGNGTGAGSYYDWAFKEWDWFRNSGLINGSHQVNDGLNGSCQNNGGTTWTYNQGVILTGLVELWRITGDRGYLWESEQIAEATINGQVHPGGILREPCESSCDGDQRIFKGIFAVGLARLYFADPGNKPGYGTFLQSNADSVWNTDRTSDNGFGLSWVGPAGSVDEATQAAAGLLLDQASFI